MKAYPNNPENRLPISLIHGAAEWALTLTQAKRLGCELLRLASKVDKHFACTALIAGSWEIPCALRGSVKQPDGTYLCKRHAKNAAKEPKWSQKSKRSIWLVRTASRQQTTSPPGPLAVHCPR